MFNKILVLEEDPDFCGFLQEYFKVRNVEVICSNNASQALGRMLLNDIQMVISDIQIPEYKDGVSFIMKSKHYFPCTPIIAISGGSSHISDDEYFKLVELVHVNKVMKKPFDMNVLTEEMHAIEQKITGSK